MNALARMRVLKAAAIFFAHVAVAVLLALFCAAASGAVWGTEAMGVAISAAVILGAFTGFVLAASNWDDL